MTPVRMWRGAAVAAALAGLLALAGCSGGPVTQDGGGREEQFAGLTRLLPLPGLTPGPAAAPPVVIADSAPDRRLVAELASRNARAQLAEAGRNGPVTTWLTADAISLSLTAPGVVIATRGLGDDLHVADVAATVAALTAARGAEGLRRTHRIVDGGQRLTSTDYVCTLRPQGRDRLQIGDSQRTALRFEETCKDGAGTSFTNRYWRAPDRAQIWASEQWLGAELGSITLTFATP